MRKMRVLQGFTAQQLMILEETEQMVNERDEEITRIARSIEELAQIFKELAVLVIDQGTILDRIDFNMEQVLAHTTEGIQQLQKVGILLRAALIRCQGTARFIVLFLLSFLLSGGGASKERTAAAVYCGACFVDRDLACNSHRQACRQGQEKGLELSFCFLFLFPFCRRLLVARLLV